MKTKPFLSDPLCDCLDIILWCDILNGEVIASVDFVALIREHYSLNSRWAMKNLHSIISLRGKLSSANISKLNKILKPDKETRKLFWGLMFFVWFIVALIACLVIFLCTQWATSNFWGRDIFIREESPPAGVWLWYWPSAWLSACFWCPAPDMTAQPTQPKLSAGLQKN